MPESPEVTYLSNYISRYCQGKVLTSVDIKKGRYAKHGAPMGFDAFVTDLPLKLVDVTKKAKITVLHFEKGWYIVSKLGMMGWWYVNYDRPEWMRGGPNIEFKFPDIYLQYHDTLSYGTLTFTRDLGYIEKEFNRLAPEVEKVTVAEVMERIAKKKAVSKKLIEDVLLDQTAIVSGVGNYLKSEILYEARISPKRRVDSFTTEDWKIFLAAARKVIKRKVKTVCDLDKYSATMYVYSKSVDPLGNKIETHKTKDNRTTYWVPSLQK
jgi:endonuclease-8